MWRRRSPPATALQLVVPSGEHRGFIHRYHDSIFTGHLSVSRTVCRLLDRVHWPGLHEDVQSYLASCSVCLARKSPCPRHAPMPHVFIGHRWDRVAMDILVCLLPRKGAIGMFSVIVDYFSRWIEACPLPNKTVVVIADAFFHLIICRFGMPAVIHSDQGREFENHVGAVPPARDTQNQYDSISSS